MARPAGESDSDALRLDFDRRLKLDSTVPASPPMPDCWHIASSMTRLARYRERGLRRYFRADAAFANPEVYEFLEAEDYKYAIRLPANHIMQDKIGYLLKRPVGRPPHHVRRYYANFRYRAASWDTSRRVVAKVEWHPGELYPASASS